MSTKKLIRMKKDYTCSLRIDVWNPGLFDNLGIHSFKAHLHSDRAFLFETTNCCWFTAGESSLSHMRHEWTKFRWYIDIYDVWPLYCAFFVKKIWQFSRKIRAKQRTKFLNQNTKLNSTTTLNQNTEPKAWRIKLGQNTKPKTEPKYFTIILNQ